MTLPQFRMSGPVMKFQPVKLHETNQHRQAIASHTLTNFRQKSFELEHMFHFGYVAKWRVMQHAPPRV